jgi:ribosomal-protein-alanine N-acetyltransferase
MPGGSPTRFPIDLHPRFRRMLLSDLDAIMALERVCYPTPWSVLTYRRELTHNQNASYWVVEPGIPSLEGGTAVTWRTLDPILAYGGMWLLGEEAHVTTIATHPAWRRRKLGEWTLLRLLEVAHEAGVSLVTLEVRAHNHPALALYLKLGFVEVGLRRGYYQDTGEDARLLTLYEVDRPTTTARLARLRAAIEGTG